MKAKRSRRESSPDAATGAARSPGISRQEMVKAQLRAATVSPTSSTVAATYTPAERSEHDSQSARKSVAPASPAAAAPIRSAAESPPRHDTTVAAVPAVALAGSSPPANRQASVASTRLPAAAAKRSRKAAARVREVERSRRADGRAGAARRAAVGLDPQPGRRLDGVARADVETAPAGARPIPGRDAERRRHVGQTRVEGPQAGVEQLEPIHARPAGYSGGGVAGERCAELGGEVGVEQVGQGPVEVGRRRRPHGGGEAGQKALGVLAQERVERAPQAQGLVGVVAAPTPALRGGRDGTGTRARS